MSENALPEADGTDLHQRAIDLFTFLREVVALRSKIVRGLDSYEQVIWLANIPREPECHCVAWEGSAIGRSLVRCGSVDGCAILMKFLDDARAVLAEHAHAELAAVCGCDLGKDVAAWQAWLDKQGEGLPGVPWSAAPEPVSSWNEDVLIDAAAKRPGGSDSTSQQAEGLP